MNITEILEEIEKLPLCDMSRIEAHLSRIIDDEERLKPIKASLSIGQDISIFDPYDNVKVQGKLVSVLKTNVRILREDDGKIWKYPICWINLNNTDSINFPIEAISRNLSRNNLSVGEMVSFRNNNEDQYGKVIKLNPKTAKIRLNNGDLWNVAYPLLTRIIDGDQPKQTVNLLQGDVIDISPVH